MREKELLKEIIKLEEQYKKNCEKLLKEHINDLKEKNEIKMAGEIQHIIEIKSKMIDELYTKIQIKEEEEKINGNEI